MEFRILGPLEVRSAAGVVPLGRGRRAAILAMLLLRPNEVVASDALIEGVWGERPPETASTALQGHVSALRKLLEPERTRGAPGRLLVTRAPGYLLRIGPEQLDLARFMELRTAAGDAARSGHTVRAGELL